jgi:hypothetical protein
MLGLVAMAQAAAWAVSIRGIRQVPAVAVQEDPGKAAEPVPAEVDRDSGPVENSREAVVTVPPGPMAIGGEVGKREEDPFQGEEAAAADTDGEKPATAAEGDVLLLEAREKALLEALAAGKELPDEVPVVSGKPSAPLDTPITDETVLAHLDAGINLRSSGDMQGALQQLRAAAAVLPEHPRILYHLALTLDTMGLLRKSQPLWEQLRGLGEDAGDLYTIARDRLRDGVPAPVEPEEQREGRFVIRSLDEERMDEPGGGERLRFSALLEKKTGEPVSMDRMTLAIHFFDTVNGRRIARSLAEEAVLSCLSEPVDWKDGTETFGFEYRLAPMTPDEIQRIGRCRYYGCTLELIYEDRLQDATATTPELLQIARELPLPEAVPSDPLLETGPLPRGAVLPLPDVLPENLLFPPPIRGPVSPR